MTEITDVEARQRITITKMARHVPTAELNHLSAISTSDTDATLMNARMSSGSVGAARLWLENLGETRALHVELGTEP